MFAISYVAPRSTLKNGLNGFSRNYLIQLFLPCLTDKKKSTTSSSSNGSSRNLWVSGLSTSTRATDLKHHFSKFGKVRDLNVFSRIEFLIYLNGYFFLFVKVIGAKIVTYARTPGVRCFGYITMATSEDASKCIQHLHRTEIHGRMISVERVSRACDLIFN